MAKLCTRKIIVIFASLGYFSQSFAIPINIRVPNPPLNQQQQGNQGTYYQHNGGMNGPLVHNAHPSQINYNNDHGGYQERFQRQQQQQQQNPPNSPQDSNHNYVKDESHKMGKPIYRNEIKIPQFQNYLYQKQNLHSRQKSPDPYAVNNNGNERSSQPQQTYGQGQVQIEQICTSTGCRNRNDQVNIVNSQHNQNHNQNALHEIQQPQVHQYNTNNEKRYNVENYVVVESNKNFLLPNSVGNNNGNNRANILDARKARAVENKDLAVGQRAILPPHHRPHPNSFLAPSASAIAVADAKNKGKGQNSGLVKIEYDIADKDVSDTYETTMELVADEL